MTHEEEYIRKKAGTRNPFTVPDGYFDHLADDIISRLPADDSASAGSVPEPARKLAVIRYLRPLLYAAACIALAVVVGSVFRTTTQDDAQLVAQQQETTTVTSSTETYADTYLDDMADYAMLDNEDIYASLLADL